MTRPDCINYHYLLRSHEILGAMHDLLVPIDASLCIYALTTVYKLMVLFE